jgi:hypothetical protein
MLISVTFGMTRIEWYRGLLVGTYASTVVRILLTTVTLRKEGRIE